MSKLAVSPDLLVQQLFECTQPDLRIVGASFDAQRQVVLLDVEGPGVPEADEIIAVCHRQPPLRVEFQPR
jgi:hypothetical protein